MLYQLKDEKIRITYPNALEMLAEAHDKAGEIKSDSSKRRIRPRIIVIAAIIVVLCLLGAAVNQYWFPSDINGKAFQAVQDRGYVNMINQTQKNNGISLTIEAILTDQLTTYVRIRA